MNGFVYRAVWPVLDQDRTLVELVAEAQPDLDDMVWAAGVVLLAAPAWRVEDGELVAAAPARRLAEPPATRAAAPMSREERLRHLAEVLGRTDWQIADLMRCSEAAVVRARQVARPPIRAGRGVASLHGLGRGGGGS